MKLQLNQNDYRIFESLTEYRMMTINQISALLQSNKTATSRRMKAFKKAGLVETLSRPLGRGRGRPEALLCLAEKGFNALKEGNVLDPSLSYNAVAADTIHCQNHQILMNWFRIHLEQVQRLLPQWSYRIFTYSSPLLPPGPEMRPVLSEHVPSANASGEKVRFSPDAVFASRDAKTGKQLLFFLEVDMGTETLARPDRNLGDVREKLLNYQACFRTQQYKRYEKVWGCRFKGFRLLFLTHTQGRLSSLCRLVQQMQPSDFIWLTEQRSMFSMGAADNIWVRGGKLEAVQESILGSLCCHAPIPNIAG